MPMYQNDTAYVGATQLAVGNSSIVMVKPTDQCYGYSFKWFSGGSLEIVKSPVALSGASALGWGAGYLVGSSETVEADGSARFFLAATGGTAVVHMLIGYTPGATFLTSAGNTAL